MNTEEDQVSLFGHDGCAGRTLSAHSAQGIRKGRTSALSWKKSFELKAIPYMFMDLTPGHGNLLGNSYWEILSPLLGGSSILNTGPAPLSGESASTLSQILEVQPHPKYYLSKTACLGILRRAKERGKELPPQLRLALIIQAGLNPTPQKPLAEPATLNVQDCLNPWDTQQARVFTPESKAPTLTGADGGGGRNPAGLLFAAGVVSKGNGDCFLTAERHTSLSGGGGQAGQGYPCVLTAGFCAGAGPSAGSIGYQEEVAPTLKAASSGNMMPSILCLNDQGGQRMDCTTDITSTLRAQMGGHQPLICLNDQGGSIMECSENVIGTLRAQEHGHQPLVMSAQPDQEALLFENYGIDSRYTGPHPVSPTLSHRAGTGGNNLPIMLQKQPAAYSRQWVDTFVDDKIASTESARQHKDATDLICQTAGGPLLIRRLTPRECERLQGYPDDFTNIPGASDSARYRALGNSVSIPCVEYIMRGLVMAADINGDNASNLSHDH